MSADLSIRWVTSLNPDLGNALEAQLGLPLSKGELFWLTRSVALLEDPVASAVGSLLPSSYVSWSNGEAIDFLRSRASDMVENSDQDQLFAIIDQLGKLGKADPFGDVEISLGY